MQMLPTLVLVLLPLATGVCQVTSGTVVIVDFTKDKIVIAADSRGVHYDRALPPTEKECKISLIGEQGIFATSGGIAYNPGDPRDPVQRWSSDDAASEAFEKARSAAHGQKPTIDSVTAFWAQSAVSHWNSLYVWHLPMVADTARVAHGLLTSAFFAQADGGKLEGRFVLVTLDTSKLTPIGAAQNDKLESCWSCGQATGNTVCAFGSLDVAAEICKSSGWHSQRLDGLDTPEATTLGLAKMTAACDLSGFVGGPIDMVELRKNGSRQWLRRKPHCPQ